MPDLLSSTFRLSEQSKELPLFTLLQDAFANSADYKAIPFGMRDSGDWFICYLQSLCSSQKLIYSLEGIDEQNLLVQLGQYYGTNPTEGDFQSCMEAICHGSAILCKHASSTGIIVNISEVQQRAVSTPITENVLQGPMNAFIENLDTNVALIRQQIRSSQLKMWETVIGSASHTRVALFYYEGAMNALLLSHLQEKLKQINITGLRDINQLLKLLSSKKRMHLFPLGISTERPDHAATDLLKGKAVIMVDGSPFALSLPSVYTDFWHSPEDDYMNPYVAYFLLSLRFIAMFLNLFLPALYVALTSINVDVNRLEISLAASASREAVPYPVFIETILMLIVIDLITEAGLRLPKTISSTVTMVGGVVLGQAIIQAHIVSHLLVIIVATTAISNYIVIDYQMGLVQRILKYFIVIGASIAGLLGIVFCFSCLIIYLSCLESFGAPYLTSLLPKKRTKPS
ncbi:spore germination protein [Paenibacillus sp. HB172176]|uniref:spore germination protein n=1 Tax=Paenibacillus sp. HB172176 TaxID=2493690 RepID=UPI001438D8A5|nr:spore germination protein [Paenibacillus sp. HB172176]